MVYTNNIVADFPAYCFKMNSCRLCCTEEWLRSLHEYELVVPERIDRDGNVFPHHRHYLRKRSIAEDPSEGSFNHDMGEESLFATTTATVAEGENTSSSNDTEYSKNTTRNNTKTTSNDRSSDEENDSDTTLLYRVRAFGRSLLLALERDEDVSAPYVLFEEVDASSGNARLLHRSDFNAHCLHRGRIRRDNNGAAAAGKAADAETEEDDSDVVLSLCHNMVSRRLLFQSINSEISFFTTNSNSKCCLRRRYYQVYKYASDLKK